MPASQLQVITPYNGDAIRLKFVTPTRAEKTSDSRYIAHFNTHILEASLESSLIDGSRASSRLIKNISNLKTIATWAGRGLGAISVYEHGSEAYSAFEKEGLGSLDGWVNFAKAGIDIGFMVAKSNPLVFTASMIYFGIDIATSK